MGVRQRAKVSHTAVQGFESGCWKSEPNFFRRASSELDGALGPGYEPAGYLNTQNKDNLKQINDYFIRDNAAI